MEVFQKLLMEYLKLLEKSKQKLKKLDIENDDLLKVIAKYSLSL